MLVVGRKRTPPSSSSTSEALGFSAPGLQNLDMAAGSGGSAMAGVVVVGLERKRDREKALWVH